MASNEFHPLTVADVTPACDDAVAVRFDVPPSLQPLFAFAPGQHVTLRHTAPEGEVRRSYSVCAAPGEALRVGVRRVPGGAMSNWLHDTLRPGLVLEVMPPQGRFGAALARPAAGGRHVLGVAGGSGITPILSILQAVLAAEPRSRCTLLYGNRTLASTMFHEELQALKNRYLARLALHPVFSREAVDLPLYSGRLDGARIGQLLSLVGDVDEAFICGPHDFNDAAEAALLARGLQAQQVHVERFGVPPAWAAPVAPAMPVANASLAHLLTARRVRLVRDGVTREITMQPEDTSVLAAARRAGLALPYSCQSGVCATCRAKCVEGQVTMARNFALEPAEVAAGWVLACQARPTGNSLVLDFDAR